MNSSSQTSARTFNSFVLAAAVFCVCVGIRAHLAGMPLERDEGEYAYMGQRILAGVPPFADAFAMKFPGIYAAYALILKIFGQTDSGIRTALILINTASCAFLYATMRKLGNERAGLWAAACYAVSSLAPAVLGMTANAEHFILFFALGGTFFLTRSLRNRDVLAAGICFGLAMTMKQQGALFTLFGGLWLLFLSRRTFPASTLRKQLTAYIAGVLIPLLVTAGWMWKAGVWNSFWFWCVTYARYYGSAWTLHHAVTYFLTQFSPVAVQLGSILLAGVLGLWMALKKDRLVAVLILLWAVCGFVAITPGWIFRPHYFLFLLPAISIAAGLALSSMRWVLPIALALFLPILLQWNLWFASPTEAIRQLYPNNAFLELRTLGMSLRQIVLPDQNLAVLGSEPEIFFYARHASSIPYIYMYPLMESQPFAAGMQKHLMDILETQPPDYLVHVRAPRSWLVHPAAPKMMIEWMPPFLASHYILLREIDLGCNEEGTHRNIILYRRRTALP